MYVSRLAPRHTLTIPRCMRARKLESRGRGDQSAGHGSAPSRACRVGCKKSRAVRLARVWEYFPWWSGRSAYLRFSALTTPTFAPRECLACFVFFKRDASYWSPLGKRRLILRERGSVVWCWICVDWNVGEGKWGIGCIEFCWKKVILQIRVYSRFPLSPFFTWTI